MIHILTHAAKAACLTAALFLLAVPGCAPVQQAATDHSFYSTGQPSLEVRFTQPLTLAASGRFMATVPSDVSIDPSAATTFAVFGEGTSGPVLRHGHVMISSLPSNSWLWAMETWPGASSLHMSKMTSVGQYWTVQMFPVVSLGDWYSEFWLANGREIPRFWLAKRWSATPYTDVRIVAEYREPAPACMSEALLPLEGIARQEQVSAPDGTELRGLCRKEIDDFSARADAAVLIDRFTSPRKDSVTFRSAPMPQGRPDMKKLAGEAESVDKSNSSNWND